MNSLSELNVLYNMNELRKEEEQLLNKIHQAVALKNKIIQRRCQVKVMRKILQQLNRIKLSNKMDLRNEFRQNKIQRTINVYRHLNERENYQEDTFIIKDSERRQVCQATIENLQHKKNENQLTYHFGYNIINERLKRNQPILERVHTNTELDKQPIYKFKTAQVESVYESALQSTSPQIESINISQMSIDQNKTLELQPQIIQETVINSESPHRTNKDKSSRRLSHKSFIKNRRQKQKMNTEKEEDLEKENKVRKQKSMTKSEVAKKKPRIAGRFVSLKQST